MILLYTLLLLLLGVAKFLIGRRTASLEKKYAAAATTAGNFLRTPLYKEGNKGQPDPYQSAKRQYLLGVLVQKRDRLEGQYEVWQGRAERFAKLVGAVRDWKGKKLPYTLGVLDVSLILCMMDYLGFGEFVRPQVLVDYVTALISR